LDEVAPHEELIITVWDWHAFRPDRFLGQAAFTIQDLVLDGVSRTHKLLDFSPLYQNKVNALYFVMYLFCFCFVLLFLLIIIIIFITY